jgi:CNT family concentrative nucleoside transporter
MSTLTTFAERYRLPSYVIGALFCCAVFWYGSYAGVVAAYLREYNRYTNILGILVILGIAYLFSHNKTAINKRLILNALMVQVALAFFVLKTSLGHGIVAAIASGVGKLYRCGEVGTQFLFGSLSIPQEPWGFIFALKVLPLIIFFGAFMSLLFHANIIQRIVGGLNYLIQPILGTSGAETLCAIANSFLGQTEAPLLIRHYLGSLTKSELLVVMVSGMGTISGAILAVYAAMGIPAEHLLSASVMAIPGTILIAKILYPETQKNSSAERPAEILCQKPTGNFLDAIATGTSDGLQLALNVGAMLLSFLALIALLNYGLAGICQAISYLCHVVGFSCGIPDVTLQDIFGVLFAPFGWLMGLEGLEIYKAGQLLGTKVAVNEMVAYSSLLTMNLSARAVNLITYALCGFSNFSCIGIQIGGIGALAPEKRAWLSELGLYAVLGGTLANLLSTFIAGLLL